MDAHPNPAATSIVQLIAMEMIDETGAAVATGVEFGYDSTDPYAVSATFDASHDDIRWSLARDLLANGLFEPSGDGDVHAWPTLSASGRAAVILELCSASGCAMLQADTADILAFLDRTNTIVKPGTESGHLDVDTLIGAILDAAPSTVQVTARTRPLPGMDRLA
jgi:hypothetical protein